MVAASRFFGATFIYKHYRISFSLNLIVKKNISRRSFLKTGAVAAAGLTIVPGSVLGKSFGYTAPSDKLNIAGIGVGGMGRRNLANMNTENIVALCDVDWHYADKTF